MLAGHTRVLQVPPEENGRTKSVLYSVHSYLHPHVTRFRFSLPPHPLLFTGSTRFDLAENQNMIQNWNPQNAVAFVESLVLVVHSIPV